jgi:hypothetical protein
MKASLIAVASLAFAAQLAYAAPSKNPDDLAGTWNLDEGSSDDPVRVLSNGDHGRSRGGRFATSGTIFGVPVGGAPRQENDDDEGVSQEDVRGVEHVFEATYRLRIRRDGHATEIRYGNEPTITYYDDSKAERNGVTVRARWDGGTFAIEHQRDISLLVTERYWVDSRTGDLHWSVHFTHRKRSDNIDRVFERAANAGP